jgi:hypothetical protein
VPADECERADCRTGDRHAPTCRETQLADALASIVDCYRELGVRFFAYAAARGLSPVYRNANPRTSLSPARCGSAGYQGVVRAGDLRFLASRTEGRNQRNLSPGSENAGFPLPRSARSRASTFRCFQGYPGCSPSPPHPIARSYKGHPRGRSGRGYKCRSSSSFQWCSGSAAGNSACAPIAYPSLSFGAGA